MQNSSSAVNVSFKTIKRNAFFEEAGEFLYQFSAIDGNNRDFQYQIKIIVE